VGNEGYVRSRRVVTVLNRVLYKELEEGACKIVDGNIYCLREEQEQFLTQGCSLPIYIENYLSAVIAVCLDPSIRTSGPCGMLGRPWLPQAAAA
jgi:hypothetical protein